MVPQKTIVRLQGVGNAPCSYSSLYSLTLDEVQNQLGNLGKPLGSMNLDELLRTVWTAEAIDHSGDTFSLSHDLAKKNVEEVCREIQHGLAFSDITLEDLLAQAGVVIQSNGGSRLGCAEQNSQWTEHQSRCPMPILNSHVGDSAYLDMSISSSNLMTRTGRKRLAFGEMAEKTGETRQKRMIKNRESAARSRARKQARTQEMEIKISLLEEENRRLRRKKESKIVLPSAPPPEPKYQLRRTSSSPL